MDVSLIITSLLVIALFGGLGWLILSSTIREDGPWWRHGTGYCSSAILFLMAVAVPVLSSGIPPLQPVWMSTLGAAIALGCVAWVVESIATWRDLGLERNQLIAAGEPAPDRRLPAWLAAVGFGLGTVVVLTAASSVLGAMIAGIGLQTQSATMLEESFRAGYLQGVALASWVFWIVTLASGVAVGGVVAAIQHFRVQAARTRFSHAAKCFRARIAKERQDGLDGNQEPAPSRPVKPLVAAEYGRPNA